MISRLGSTGKWRVYTQTAVYDIDMDAKTVKRSPNHEYKGDYPVSKLREDDKTTPFHHVVQCEPNKGMVLVIDVTQGQVETIRATTPVRKIEAVDAQKSDPARTGEAPSTQG